MSLEQENAALVEQLAAEKAKNEVLMEQVLQAEDEIADQDVESFSDVIPNDDRGYWRDRILENRRETLSVLARMRNRAGGAAGAVPARKPMHNRVTAKVGAAAPAAAAAAPASDRARAIRNRAQEIAKSEKCAFHVAWGRAEKELGA